MIIEVNAITGLKMEGDHKPENDKLPLQVGRGNKQIHPSNIQEKCSHADDALISAKTHFGRKPSGLQHNTLMLFKPLSLWEFLAAAIRNQCIALLGAL